VGSPVGREPYGDGGPVVAAGVTTGQGGRESRPQGEGGQVTGLRYPFLGIWQLREGRQERCRSAVAQKP
jgi:hypothetical protein